MSGSSTSRRPAARRRCRPVCALLALARALPRRRRRSARSASATMSQYIRDQWGSDRGFPGGPVYADHADRGRLSVDRGREGAGPLRRADVPAVRAVRVTTERSRRRCSACAATPDGSLWARLRGPALVRYRDGAFENISSTARHAGVGGHGDGARPNRRHPARDARPRRGRLPRRAASPTIAADRGCCRAPFVISIAETADGDIWLGTRDAGAAPRAGSQVIARSATGLPDLKDQLPARRRRTATCGSAPTTAWSRWNGSEITAARACRRRSADRPRAGDDSRSRRERLDCRRLATGCCA